MKKIILSIIFLLILMCNMVSSLNISSNTFFNPSLSNVTYHFLNNVSVTNITVDEINHVSLIINDVANITIVANKSINVTIMELADSYNLLEETDSNEQFLLTVNGMNDLNFSYNEYNLTTVPILSLQSIPAITLSPFTTTSVEVLFNVSDSYADLNDSLAFCNFSKTGEATRTTNSCIAQQQSGDDIVYNCSLDMSFYDGAGFWNVTCYAEDDSGLNNTAEGNVTVNALHYITQNIILLNWSNINIGENDMEANKPIIFTNGGNQDYNTINITSQNATHSSHTIIDTAFMVDEQTEQTSGQTYLNDTGIIWNEGKLLRCNSPCSTNSTEIAYFYVDVPAGIIMGTYNSITSWEILFR